MKKRTKRWLILARNWGIFLGILLVIWIIVKIARPNVNYAFWDKYFHRRKMTAITDMIYTNYIEDVCDPDTEISVYNVDDLRAGLCDGITYNDALYILNDRYFIQGEDFSELLETTELEGYGEVRLVRGMAAALKELLDAAEKETGERFILGDSYLPLSSQKDDHGNDCYLAQYSDTSEHPTGMGVDLLVPGQDFRTYMRSDLAKWLQDNAWRFGFTIRYPFWEGEWTGVFFQPWHLKYVGQPHAAYLYKTRMTLEEYLAKTYDDKRWYFTDVTGEDGAVRTYVVYRQNAYEGTIYIPDTLSAVAVSFDNTYRYYYVTGVLR